MSKAKPDPHCAGCPRRAGDDQPKAKKARTIATVLTQEPRWPSGPALLCQSCGRKFRRHASLSPLWWSRQQVDEQRMEAERALRAAAGQA